MEFKNYLATIRNHLYNVRGNSLSKKVIVFESDDWGSLRMPSKKVYDQLTDAGVSLKNNPYNRVDSLETEDDLTALFETLSKFKDLKDNTPVITTNFVMANPDFTKIAESGFKQYFFEPFTRSYEAQSQTAGSFELVQQGMESKLIRPQFHGREHLNVQHWLTLLHDQNAEVLTAFSKNVFCIDLIDKTASRDNLMAAFDYADNFQKDFVLDSLSEGLRMFHENFGYESASMIAPCNVWGDSVEQVAFENNVRYFQSLRGRLVPKGDGSGFDKRFPVNGSRNALGQYYFVRNVYFEPATSLNYPWVSNALNKIEAAFFWNKPAIISTHRLNFIGSIDPQNRTKNLKMLEELLAQILQKWPDVEFISSDELGTLYEK